MASLCGNHEKAENVLENGQNFQETEPVGEMNCPMKSTGTETPQQSHEWDACPLTSPPPNYSWATGEPHHLCELGKYGFQVLKGGRRAGVSYTLSHPEPSSSPMPVALLLGVSPSPCFPWESWGVSSPVLSMGKLISPMMQSGFIVK